jgi:hypothetical protein
VSLISNCVFRLIQKPDEVASEIFFSIKFIIGVFTLRPLFNDFSFVLRNNKRMFIAFDLIFRCCHVLPPACHCDGGRDFSHYARGSIIGDDRRFQE